MLKAIALAGIFIFTSAVVPSVNASSKTTTKSTISTPKAPAPQGWCPTGC
ncbi:MAG TPA: hypothetical protein VHL80_10680 [Polyangia bacterium]|nr:hypothetical protein [Polyangia bacterium]